MHSGCPLELDLIASLHPPGSLGAQPEAALAAEAEGERAAEQPAAATAGQSHHHGQEALPGLGRSGARTLSPTCSGIRVS